MFLLLKIKIKEKIMILMYVEERLIFIGLFGVKWFWLCVEFSGGCCVCVNFVDKVKYFIVVFENFMFIVVWL